MVKILGILLFGIVMCGLSAAGSWFVQKHVLAPQPVAEAEAVPGEPPPVPTLTPPQGAAPRNAGGGAESLPGGGERLPVAVRPREMSVEELLRFGMGVKQREQQVRQQEELLQQQRVRQQLALADIEGERREVDGLRVQVADQLKTAEKLVQRLHQAKEDLLQERSSAEDDLKQLKEARMDVDEQSLSNTKRLSQWMQSMDPEKAANVLKEMANDGSMDIAVEILSFFEEREAAKILSALDDPKLIQQFAERFRNRKQPTKTAGRN